VDGEKNADHQNEHAVEQVSHLFDICQMKKSGAFLG
jgi:hypothetical protein